MAASQLLMRDAIDADEIFAFYQKTNFGDKIHLSPSLCQDKTEALVHGFRRLAIAWIISCDVASECAHESSRRTQPLRDVHRVHPRLISPPCRIAGNWRKHRCRHFPFEQRWNEMVEGDDFSHATFKRAVE
jgi:hypothetical protein